MLTQLAIIVRAVFSFLLSPMVFCETYIEELGRDDSINKVGPNNIDSLVQTIPILIVPLSEFERLGCSLAGVENVKKQFVLMYPVAFDINKVGGIGSQLAHAPGMPNIRYVPDGFVTDFASIPLGSPYGSYNRAAVVHDWAYSHHHDRSTKGRNDCDMAMLHIMREDGTSPLFRSIIFVGLYIGGEFAFQAAPGKRKKLHETLYPKQDFIATFNRSQSSMMTHMSTKLESVGMLEEGWTLKAFEQMQNFATPEEKAMLAQVREKMDVASAQSSVQPPV